MNILLKIASITALLVATQAHSKAVRLVVRAPEGYNFFEDAFYPLYEVNLDFGTLPLSILDKKKHLNEEEVRVQAQAKELIWNAISDRLNPALSKENLMLSIDYGSYGAMRRIFAELVSTEKQSAEEFLALAFPLGRRLNFFKQFFIDGDMLNVSKWSGLQTAFIQVLKDLKIQKYYKNLDEGQKAIAAYLSQNIDNLNDSENIKNQLAELLGRGIYTAYYKTYLDGKDPPNFIQTLTHLVSYAADEGLLIPEEMKRRITYLELRILAKFQTLLWNKYVSLGYTYTKFLSSMYPLSLAWFKAQFPEEVEVQDRFRELVNTLATTYTEFETGSRKISPVKRAQP